MTPTINLEKYWGIPVTLKAPTYVTVGPHRSGMTTAGRDFGASSGTVGMFTTGLTAIMPLSLMPAQYGHWYAKAGFQWYDVINTALQNANAFSVDGNATLRRGQRRQLQQHHRRVRRHRRSLLIG